MELKYTKFMSSWVRILLNPEFSSGLFFFFSINYKLKLTCNKAGVRQIYMFIYFTSAGNFQPRIEQQF